MERLLVSGEKYRALLNGERGLKPALCRLGLRVASVPYGWAVWLRNRLYDRGYLRVYRASIPVISVGNLTLGGTGKTPCVEYVARFFRQRGRRVAILSRGYGGAAKSRGSGEPGGVGSPKAPNDEALVLHENLPDVPHLQGPHRATLAATAVRDLASEVLVLDDGFQHRRLARDLDLVLLDATEPWGFGYLFPRGGLREPPAELGRASAVILTRCNRLNGRERGRLREAVIRAVPGAPIIETSHRPIDLVNSERVTAGLERLSGRTVAAFCGIGNPEAFRHTLIDLGAKVVAWRTLADHHRYSPRDVEELQLWAGRLPAECLIATTQKDLVKIRTVYLGGKELWAVRIRLQVDAGERELHMMLDSVLKEPSEVRYQRSENFRPLTSDL